MSRNSVVAYRAAGGDQSEHHRDGPARVQRELQLRWGLQPYFALDRATKDGGRTQRGEFEFGGERWEVTLYYQRRKLREGKTLWLEAGKSEIAWQSGMWEAQVKRPRHPELRTIDGGTATDYITGKLWEIDRR